MSSMRHSSNKSMDAILHYTTLHDTRDREEGPGTSEEG
jgi:hypothetical protein